ncbi:integration host factor subunit beta [Candidatus Pelagibacter sp.]|nr:integration host factor subunit beta [Candidatus Pelagibacter sp.]
MSAAKSDLIKKLTNNYPNFLRKDLEKLIDIFLTEIKHSLKRKERVELRDVFSLETRYKKAKFARNPKTNEKVYVKEKYSILFKASKMWLSKINEKK